MKCCPHCGQQMPTSYGDPPNNLVAIEKRIYMALAHAGHSGLEASSLVQALYSHRSDGGPTTANKCVHVYVNRMNKKLAQFGKEISRSDPHYSIRRDLRPISSLGRRERDRVTHFMMRHIARANDISQSDIAARFNLFRSEVRAHITKLRNYRRRPRQPSARDYNPSHRANGALTKWPIQPDT